MSLKEFKYENKLSKRSKVSRLIWNIVYVVLFRPTPRWAFSKWRVFLLRLFGAKIGDGCSISPTCKIWAPWNLEIGSLVCFADDVDCYCVDKITIGSKVTISQRSFICTGSHEIETLHRKLIHHPVSIADHVWVCAEVFIGPGTNIGEGAVVAARSVVVHNVEDWNVVAGNPAKTVRKRLINSGN